MMTLYKKCCFSTLLLTCLLFGVVLQAGNEFNVFYRSGYKKIRTKKYADAIKDFRKALDFAKLSQEESRAIFGIADAYYRQHNFKQSVVWLERLFELPDLTRKNMISAYQRLVDCHIKQKQYDDALYLCKRAIKKIDDKKVAQRFYLKAADIFSLRKDNANAINALKRAISLCDPKGTDANLAKVKMAILYYGEKRYNDALNTFPVLDFQTLKPNDKRTVGYYCGLSAMKLKKYQTAMGYFNGMPDSAKKGDWLQYGKLQSLALCLQSMKQHKNALAYYMQIANEKSFRASSRASALLTAASIKQRNLKDAKGAVLLYKEVLKIKGAHASQKKLAANCIKKIETSKKK